MRWRVEVCMVVVLSVLCFNPRYDLGSEPNALSNPYAIAAVVPNALAGVPVPIIISATNNTQTPFSVYQLVDPYMGLVFPKWRWNGDAWTVDLFSLHYNAIPSLGFPTPIVVPANEQRSWMLLVATPTSIGQSETATVEITVKNPLKLPTMPDDGVTLRADVRIVKRDFPSAKEHPPDLLQAALLCYPDDALVKLDKQARWGSIRRYANQGDILASLLLFSKAVAERKDVPVEWNKLNDAPMEVRAIRNAILLNRLESPLYRRENQSKPFSQVDRRTVLSQIAAGDPLESELRRVLSASK